MGHAASGSGKSANLEHIGEVAAEGERQEERDGFGRIIMHHEPLVERIARHEHRPRDMQQALGQDDGVAIDNVRIGEIDGEHAIVVRQIGAEQQGLEPVDQQPELREVARVVMEQAVGSAGRHPDVAMAVQHEEAVAMLHRVPRPRRRLRHGDGEGQVGSRFGVRARSGQTLNRHAVQYRPGVRLH